MIKKKKIKILMNENFIFCQQFINIIWLNYANLAVHYPWFYKSHSPVH